MLTNIPEALSELRAGKFIIIVDDACRENEGDLAIAAEKVTPEAINFLTKYARGLVCVGMEGRRLEELELFPMVQNNTARYGTAFTVSVDYKYKTSTGISAYDRAATIKALIDPNAKPGDFARPGHVFPIKAREGGVLVRAGHTEAIVDLCRIAGLYPAGVLCEILAEDGSSARMPTLEKLAQEWGVKIVTIADLIAYRRRYERLIERIAITSLPTKYGQFSAIAYKSLVDPEEHLALVMGEIKDEEPILVRVHSQCLTGDVFGSLRCDCGQQVELALQAIAREGRGVFLYMRQEGRGIGFHHKMIAYALQDSGLDTVEANKALGFPPDLRDYGIGAQILADLGVRKMRLLTNNPKKVVGLESYGLHIVETVPLLVPPNPYNQEYLKIKREKLGHQL